ncbi:MAG: hypothetical protein ABIW79_00280 [Gemmatimonas sp.]
MANATNKEPWDQDEDMKRIRDAVHVLAEHFSTVQIFATAYDGGYTMKCHAGTGNHWARVGQVRHWLMQEDESAKVEVRKDD